MKNNKKIAPKLPRFIVPKNMASKVYIDKKRRLNTRAALNKLVDFG